MTASVDVSVLLLCLMFYFCYVTYTSADDTLQRDLLARIETLEIQCKTERQRATVQRELLARIETLEIQGREQAQHIQKIESKLDIQNAKISHQHQTIEDYKQRVVTLGQTVENRQEKSVLEENEPQGTEVDDDDTIKPQSNQSIHSEIKNVRQRRLVLDDDGAVAFHAVIKAAQEKTHIGIGQKIVFPDVMINLGGGYRNQHGIFTAPRAGLYLFSTSIMADFHGHMIYVHLMKNGNILANAYAYSGTSYNDQGSVTVVTQLAVGDEVWVSNYGNADSALWGDYFDSFMGYLIMPM